MDGFTWEFLDTRIVNENVRISLAQRYSRSQKCRKKGHGCDKCREKRKNAVVMNIVFRRAMKDTKVVREMFGLDDSVAEAEPKHEDKWDKRKGMVAKERPTSMEELSNTNRRVAELEEHIKSIEEAVARLEIAMREGGDVVSLSRDLKRLRMVTGQCKEMGSG